MNGRHIGSPGRVLRLSAIAIQSIAGFSLQMPGNAVCSPCSLGSHFAVQRPEILIFFPRTLLPAAEPVLPDVTNSHGQRLPSPGGGAAERR